jgi:MFS family permease
MPCLPLLVKEWSSGKTLGLSTGIYVSGFAVGNATALGLTPHLLQLMGWRDVLLAYSGMAVVVCGLWWALARSTVKSTSEFQLKNFATILKDKYVWVLLFFMIASMGSYDTLATWMPKVLEMKELNMTLASLLPLGFFRIRQVSGQKSDYITARDSCSRIDHGDKLRPFSLAALMYFSFRFHDYRSTHNRPCLCQRSTNDSLPLWEALSVSSPRLATLGRW